MVAMTADLTVASVDLPSAKLDRTVAEYLDMASRMEMVLADHFDLDWIAAGAEALAHRLAYFRDAAAPLLAQEGPAEDLARLVSELALPFEEVLAAVRDHAGLDPRTAHQ